MELISLLKAEILPCVPHTVSDTDSQRFTDGIAVISQMSCSQEKMTTPYLSHSVTGLCCCFCALANRDSVWFSVSLAEVCPFLVLLEQHYATFQCMVVHFNAF